MRARIDTDRGECVAQKFLRVEAEPALAEIHPAFEHQIDELFDLATAARFACERQQQQLAGTERDLGLLFGRDAFDRIEEAAQRAGRMRIVEDLDHRRAPRRPIARGLLATGLREQLVVVDDARNRVELHRDRCRQLGCRRPLRRRRLLHRSGFSSRTLVSRALASPAQPYSQARTSSREPLASPARFSLPERLSQAPPSSQARTSSRESLASRPRLSVPALASRVRLALRVPPSSRALALRVPPCAFLFCFAGAAFFFGAGFAFDPAVRCFPARAIYFLNMPALYSTISPRTADAATVSGEAKYSLPGRTGPCNCD